MLDTLFWWTGCIVWAAIALAILWLLIEVLVGFATAVSWCRWSYRVMTTNKRQPQWRQLPKAFCARWLEFIGYRNHGDMKWSGDGGFWRGINDWKVWSAGKENPETHNPAT